MFLRFVNGQYIQLNIPILYVIELKSSRFILSENKGFPEPMTTG